MGRKPALHSSCSKTGAKVGISMLIDKHCQLKSCNPCQPTCACMPHWAARRPQQAHGSPGSEDDSYAPTHDDPRLTDERLKKTPTPTTVPHPANPKRNNHRTWTPECLWACDKEAVQFGHRAQQHVAHIQPTLPYPARREPRAGQAYHSTPGRLRLRHHSGPSETASIGQSLVFSTHMVWPRHSNPNDFNTELLMRLSAFKFLPLQYLRQLKHHKQLDKKSLEYKKRKEKMAAVKKLLFNKPEFFLFQNNSNC